MSVSTSREPAKIAGMFDGIARRYDSLDCHPSDGEYRHRRPAAGIRQSG